ncbi:MAG: ATP-binding cassette domain-containing protein [Candidatus Kuenenia sp.]|nr:ATP-binding cassette domain-containing protein [Candidatus Kuenenia hertensis]
MIRFHDVCLNLGSSVIFDNVSLQIRLNDRIGLIGPNGAGKSTFFKLICKYIEPSSGNIICAKDVKAGYLPQECFAFRKKTVFEEASSAFENIHHLKRQIDAIPTELENPSLADEDRQLLLDRYTHLQHQLSVVNANKINAETEKVLKGIGFKETDFGKNIEALSGGWQMRVALSKLLLLEPDILLLDEPTNHLDVDSILWLEQYLKELNGGLIIISHDRAFLDRNVSKIWELEKGSINEYHGNYSFYEAEKEKRRELQTSRYTNQQKKIKEVERFIERFRAKNTKASQVQSRIRMLEKMEKEELPENTVQKVTVRFPPAKQSGINVLEVKDVSYKYDEQWIFQGICLSIERGEKVALVGQNGSGKSTLLRIIDRLIKPQIGTVTIGHNVLADYFAQETAENLRGDNTVLEEVESIAPFSMIPHVRNLLGAFLFSGDDVFKTVNVLSGGEKSRLCLAKILLKPANFLVLDEPTNHIDITTKKVLKEALLNYPGSLLIVSHDRDFLDGLVSKVYELKEGKLFIHLGSFRNFLEKREAALRPETNRTETKETSEIKTSEISSQKQFFLQKKEQNAKRRKLEKELQKIEERISSLETQKKELDQILLDPQLYNNSDKERPIIVNKQYKTVSEELDDLYQKWEVTHADLDMINAEVQNIP